MTFDIAALAIAEGFMARADFLCWREESSQATGYDCFGLHVGRRGNPKNVAPLMYPLLNAPTIAAAYETAARYLHVHNQALQPVLEVDAQLTRFA